MLGKVRVAAHDGVDDLRLTLPGLIEGHTRAHEAVPLLGGHVCHFFAADVGEELVDIVYYLETHSSILLSLIWR